MSNESQTALLSIYNEEISHTITTLTAVMWRFSVYVPEPHRSVT